MITIERNCRTEREKLGFIRDCETSFEKRLDEACASLTSREGTRIIALSGPTCSGKTTAAGKMISELEKSGRDIHLISIDDFFKERDVLNREKEMAGGTGLDYDSVNAIDLELLEKCTESILAHRETTLPKYVFKTGSRLCGETVRPSDNSIFIFEGIQAVYPEVTKLFGNDHLSVRIGVEDDLSLNGAVFGKRDIRLMRRLVRDYRFRGAAPEFTFYIWRSVVQNEERSIEPYESGIDIRIDSLIPYEVMLMKSELTPILELIPDTNRFYPKALEFIERLSELETVTPDMIPQNSLLREFVG